MGGVKYKYQIPSNDFIAAGEASSSVKKMLAQLGIASDKIKKAAIAMYEAEINTVIHANGGTAEVEVFADKVVINIEDSGPGIPDLELAMTEGYSTAPDSIREMGFGAGMGLPNMKRCSDEFSIQSKIGEGTIVRILIHLSQNAK